MSGLVGEGGSGGRSGHDSGQEPSPASEEVSGRWMQAVATGVGPVPERPGLAVTVPARPLRVWGRRLKAPAVMLTGRRNTH